MTSFVKPNIDKTLYLWSENAKKVFLDTSTGGNVDSISLTNGGSGYTSMPTVNFSGSGGGATATATGVVNNITLNDGGSYTVAPTSVSLSGGGGSGAIATIATVKIATKYSKLPFTSYTDVVNADGTVVKILASSTNATLVNTQYWRLFDNNAFTRWASLAGTYNQTTGNSIQPTRYFNNDTDFYGEWVMIDLGESIILDYYKLAMSNGTVGSSSEGRTPQIFRIYATNDDTSWGVDNTKSGSWVQIHEVNNPSIALTGYTTFSVGNQIPYRYYAIIINKVRGIGNFGGILQMTEWELYGFPAPLTKYPRVALTNSANCKQSTFYNSTTNPTYFAFDGKISGENVGAHFAPTGQYNSSGVALVSNSFTGYNGDWAMININESFVLNKIIIYPRLTFEARCVGIFRIYGTNNTSLFTTPNWTSTDWTLIHDQTTRLTDYTYLQPKEVLISNNQPFSIYVMVVNQLAGNTNILNYQELELYGYPTLTTTKYPIYPLIDNTYCKQSPTFNQNPDTYGLFNNILNDSLFVNDDDDYNSTTGIAKNNNGFNGYDGEWVMVNTNVVFVLNKIVLYPDSEEKSAPGKFRIYGTNSPSLFTTPDFNSPFWVLIHDQTTRITVDNYIDAGVAKEILISNTQAFSIYVMVVNQLAGNWPIWSFNEWELYNIPTYNYTVNSITLNNVGSGYTTAPQVVFNGGTATTPASASTTLSLSTLAITNGGSAYTTAPTVSFSGGGGTGATATTTATPFIEGIDRCFQYDWDIPEISLNQNGKVSLEGIVYNTFTPVSTGTTTKIKNIGTVKYNYSSKNDDGVILDVSHWDYLKKKKTKNPAIPLTPQSINKISLSVDESSDAKGVDITSDFVAVLKITEDNVPKAEWGNSRAVNVRQMTIPTYNQK